MNQSDAVTTALRALDSMLRETVKTLEEIGAPDESLGQFKSSRGFLGFRAAPVMQPVGRAWRLGVLLIDRDQRLYSTGQVTRAIEPLRAVTNRSQAAERRRDDRRAAARGRFTTGEVVNHQFAAIPLDGAALQGGSGPLSIEGASVMVRWDSGQGQNGVALLEWYLKDRVSLFLLD